MSRHRPMPVPRTDAVPDGAANLRIRDDPGSTRHVAQGKYAISSDPGVQFHALLGSCVSICLHDPARGIGGMTHTVYCDMSRLGAAVPLNEFERLYNAMVKHGTSRECLRASVIGGARLLCGRSDLGVDLGEVTLAVLRREGIVVEEIALGGRSARKVTFRPTTGELRVTAIPDQPIGEERRSRPVVRGLELF